MTLSQNDVTDLLTVAAAFDNRRPAQAAVVAWSVALNLAGDTLDVDDAKEAIARHYARTRDFVMPSDVVAGVKQIRAERAARIPAEDVLMAGVDPDDPAWHEIRTARRAAYLTRPAATAAITRGA